jgi:hypothetical protein
LLQKLGGDEDCDITELGAQVSMAQWDASEPPSVGSWIKLICFSPCPWSVKVNPPTYCAGN